MDEREAVGLICLLDGRDGQGVCPGPVVVHIDAAFECVACHEVASHFHGEGAIEPCGPQSRADAAAVDGAELFSSCQRCESTHVPSPD